MNPTQHSLKHAGPLLLDGCRTAAAADRLHVRRGSLTAPEWDPKAGRLLDDEAVNAMLLPRAFRGDWRLPEAG